MCGGGLYNYRKAPAFLQSLLLRVCVRLLDDSELEAELMALEGVSPGGGGRGKAPLSVADVNKMVAGIGEVGDEDSDLSSDLDEDELLGELQVP